MCGDFCLFVQSEWKRIHVLKQQRCATYQWGSLMTQNLNLKWDCSVSLPKDPDLPPILYLVSHLCSSSLTILELPEVCQTWSSVTRFQLVGYIKQFLLCDASWRCALYIEEEARYKVRESLGNWVVKCRMIKKWLWEDISSVSLLCSCCFEE